MHFVFAAMYTAMYRTAMKEENLVCVRVCVLWLILMFCAGFVLEMFSQSCAFSSLFFNLTCFRVSVYIAADTCDVLCGGLIDGTPLESYTKRVPSVHLVMCCT